MRFTFAVLLLALGCSAQAESFSGTWTHKEGTSVESVVIQADGDAYRATNTTEPEDMWGPIHMRFVESSEHLLIDLETHEDRWELLPDGTAKSYMRNKPKIFERVK